MKKNSFLDSYFGEFAALFKDIARAPGLKNKFLYIIMPPGWSHTGDHKTSTRVRQEYLKSHQPQGPAAANTFKSNEPQVVAG
jgi:hypothetical protein